MTSLLLSLLKMYDFSECRDTHDLIYALLGMQWPEMTIWRPVNVSSLDHDLEMEALFPIETVLCIFHKCDVCILHRIRSRKTMQLSFAPDFRTKTSTELLGGDYFEIS